MTMVKGERSFMKYTTTFGRFLSTARLLVAISQSLIAEDQIRIASFNLRVFGVAKAEKLAVLAELASIIRQFDIVAVQEIRDGSGTSAGKLKEAPRMQCLWGHDCGEAPARNSMSRPGFAGCQCLYEYMVM
jgi:hypothetical protein